MKLGKQIKRNGEIYIVTKVMEYVCYAENELGNRIRVLNPRIVRML
jgi:hypothetical protein